MDDTSLSLFSSRCAANTARGAACQAPAIRGRALCFWHDPAAASRATRARHVGGLRRRREKNIKREHDLVGLDGVAGIRRVVEVAVTDALALENGIARCRVLIAGAAVLVRILELDATIQALSLEPELGGARSGQKVLR